MLWKLIDLACLASLFQIYSISIYIFSRVILKVPFIREQTHYKR